MKASNPQYRTHGLCLLRLGADMDPFQSLPDDIILGIFQRFAWREGTPVDRVSLPCGQTVKMLTALSFTCKRFRQLIEQGSPLWTRVELTGVETCWKHAELQQSFLAWLKPKQSRYAVALVSECGCWIGHVSALCRLQNAIGH